MEKREGVYKEYYENGYFFNEKCASIFIFIYNFIIYKN
jgi:hypothetical protein